MIFTFLCGRKKSSGNNVFHWSGWAVLQSRRRWTPFNSLEHKALRDADLLKHQECPTNLEHADKRTSKLRFALLSSTLLQMFVAVVQNSRSGMWLIFGCIGWIPRTLLCVISLVGRLRTLLFCLWSVISILFLGLMSTFEGTSASGWRLKTTGFSAKRYFYPFSDIKGIAFGTSIPMLWFRMYMILTRIKSICDCVTCV